MRSQAFFANIRDELLKEIAAAEETIYIAMAWFTDKGLYRKILERSEAGVEVRLLLSNDSINRDYGPDFSDLEENGGEVIWVTVQTGDNIMHNKFCVIDDRTVITGSYNWTQRAHSNHENITITWDDLKLAEMFVQEFKRLNTIYGGSSVSGLKQFDYSAVHKRLQLIKAHLDLNEFEDIAIQIQKLRQFDLIPDVVEIIDFLERSYYSDALLGMELLRQKYSAVVSVSLQKAAELRMQIRYLEIEYASAVEHRDLLNRTIADFRLKVRLALGDFILDLLNLKITWNKIKEKLGKSAKYEEMKREFENFEQELKQAKADDKAHLSTKDEAEIRELYKRGVKLCHPDTTDGAHKQEAEAIFIRLKEALDRNDVNEVRHIVESLEAGIWDLGSGNTSVNEVDKLEGIVRDLNFKIEQVRSDIRSTSEAEDYLELQQYPDIDMYITSQEIVLKKEILHYQERIKKQEDDQ